MLKGLCTEGPPAQTPQLPRAAIGDRPELLPLTAVTRARPAPCERLRLDVCETHALAVALTVTRRGQQLERPVSHAAGQVKPRAVAVHPGLHPEMGASVVHGDARAHQTVGRAVEPFTQNTAVARPIDDVTSGTPLPGAVPGADPEVEVARSVHIHWTSCRHERFVRTAIARDSRQPGDQPLARYVDHTSVIQPGEAE